MKTTHSKHRASVAAYVVLAALAAVLVAAMYGAFRIGCWLFQLSMP